MYYGYQTLQEVGTKNLLLFMGYSEKGLVCLDEHGIQITIPSKQTECIRDNLGRIVSGKITDMTTRKINMLLKKGQLRPDMEMKKLLDITDEMREVAVKKLAKDFVDHVRTNLPKYPGEYCRVDRGCNFKLFWKEVARLSDSSYNRLLPDHFWRSHDKEFGNGVPYLFKIGNRLFKIEDNFFKEVYVTDDLIRLVKEYGGT